MGIVNRGKLAVLSMLLLAVSLAAFAWWWNIESGRRTLEFWGNTDGARIIAEGAEVELLWLRPASGAEEEEKLTIGEQTYAVIDSRKVTGARGLVHARHALLEDTSFEWDAPIKSVGDYAVAVRFRDASGTTTVALDFDRQQVAHVESGGQRKAAAKIIAGWQTFAQRHSPGSETKGVP